MKWLKSTTQKTWVINGKVIPACVTPHNDYLVVEDSEFSVISATPVIKSLIKVGGILILNEEPSELKNSLSNLQVSNAELTARNEALATELAELKKQAAPTVDVEAIKEAAQAEIKEEAIKELQEKQNALDTANAEIEALKEQLAKAKAKAKASSNN